MGKMDTFGFPQQGHRSEGSLTGQPLRSAIQVLLVQGCNLAHLELHFNNLGGNQSMIPEESTQC